MRHYFALAMVVGCGGGGTQPERTLRHEFPTVEVAAGEERNEWCQSWTLGNEETLYVNRVDIEAGPGWHHSNWLFVPDQAYEGPDGGWPCSEREFEQVAAAIQGGVLAAQSTQSATDVQAFAPGHALVVPPRARVIGATHILNSSDAPLQTRLALTLHTLPGADVVKTLHGLSIQNRSLALPPQARSRFTTDCDLDTPHRASMGRPLDFRIYYVLPHYHGLGTGLTLTATGGDKDGQVVFASDSPIGEPGGGALDPPFDLTGATGLAMTCAYDNPRDATVGWGIGDQEMCVLLAFTDSELTWAGGVQEEDRNQVLGPAADGVVDNAAPCAMYGFLPRQ